MSFVQNFKKSPIEWIAAWQDSRIPWILMIIAMGGLVIVAHSFFQNYLYMLPCEQCVYIRFSMLVMALGGLIAAIAPKNIVAKIIGYVFGFYGGIIGVMYSLKLNSIHHAAHDPDNIFGVQGCSAVPTFPFNLPLHEIAPDWFKPTGDCGYDNPIVPAGVKLDSIQTFFTELYADGWYLIPSSHFGNMAQCTLLAYVVALALLSIMLICWILRSFKKSA